MNILQIIYNLSISIWRFIYSAYIWQWSRYEKLTDEVEMMYILPTPIQAYINKHKSRFLSTFEEPLASSKNWNENMKSLQIDPAELAQELTYKENEIENEWKRRVLIENTPRGNVIMYYDVYKQAFAYYCDQATMPYDIMNAVAMRYVIAFFCRDLFVDESIIPRKANTPDGENEDKPAPSPNEEKKNVGDAPFAKFKNYNTANNKMVKSGGKLVNKKTNKFIHLGQTRNHCPLNKPPKVFAMNGFSSKLLPDSEKKPDLSYAEFKAQQTQQKAAAASANQ